MCFLNEVCSEDKAFCSFKQVFSALLSRNKCIINHKKIFYIIYILFNIPHGEGKRSLSPNLLFLIVSNSANYLIDCMLVIDIVYVLAYVTATANAVMHTQREGPSGTNELPPILSLPLTLGNRTKMKDIGLNNIYSLITMFLFFEFFESVFTSFQIWKWFWNAGCNCIH